MAQEEEGCRGTTKVRLQVHVCPCGIMNLLKDFVRQLCAMASSVVCKDSGQENLRMNGSAQQDATFPSYSLLSILGPGQEALCFISLRTDTVLITPFNSNPDNRH